MSWLGLVSARRAARLGACLVAFVTIAFAGCSPALAPAFDRSLTIDPPPPDSVEAVVLLVGDAGAATWEESPVLRGLAAEVEFWSERIERDSSVTVAFLGDNVYPVGVRDRSHSAFATDSARLMSQVNVLAGPFARDRAATGFFLAGNHDWGNTSGPEGVERLRNQAALLDAANAAGISVGLHPAPGDAGPVVADVREDVRVMMIDTHWFLQSGRVEDRSRFFVRVEEALESAGDRHVIMLAHHPYSSAGPHGLLTPGDRGLGIMFLLQRSGALVQDLNSAVYSEFRERLDLAFERSGRPPLAFVGGHDHSLQVLDGTGDFSPRTSLVSGAGSKLSAVAATEDLRFAAPLPGYMSLIFRRNGAVDLFVTTVASSDGSPATPQVVYSERLVSPPDSPASTVRGTGG